MNKNANSSHEIEDRVLAGWLGDSPPGRPVEPDEALAMLDGLWAEGPSESALDEMRASLGDWWAGQTETIFYDWLSAPIGRVYVAASQVGVLSVDFNQESDSAFFDHLINRHLKNQNVRLVHAPERLESVVQQLREYFAGQRDEFDFSADLRHLTAFQRDVLQAANQIPRGQIATYKEIAQRIGKPKASRAVGNALGRNPVPILIPCHRVVTKSGALGGYSGTGGPGTKSRLLELEGVVPDHRGHYALSA